MTVPPGKESSFCDKTRGAVRRPPFPHANVNLQLVALPPINVLNLHSDSMPELSVD